MGVPIQLLLVEDDEQVVRAVHLFLEQRGGVVIDTARTLAQARQLLASRRYDVLILDRRLPDGDAVELCRERRALGDEALIAFLSGYYAANDINAATDAGADRYLNKLELPTSFGAHVDALLRRLPSAARPLGPIAFNGSTSRVVFPDGSEAPLTPNEARMLLALARDGRSGMTHGVLAAAVWDGDKRDPSGLPSLVRRLRKKLGRFHWIIETWHGRGYRFVDAQVCGEAPPRVPGRAKPGIATARSSPGPETPVGGAGAICSPRIASRTGPSHRGGLR
ncbi:MAG: response regulator transcription factor [Myxococcales bacterium]|nr:response regulator transcription factor [Myxococcales bacterium]